MHFIQVQGTWTLSPDPLPGFPFVFIFLRNFPTHLYSTQECDRRWFLFSIKFFVWTHSRSNLWFLASPPSKVIYRNKFVCRSGICRSLVTLRRTVWGTTNYFQVIVSSYIPINSEWMVPVSPSLHQRLINCLSFLLWAPWWVWSGIHCGFDFHVLDG